MTNKTNTTNAFSTPVNKRAIMNRVWSSAFNLNDPKYVKLHRLINSQIEAFDSNTTVNLATMQAFIDEINELAEYYLKTNKIDAIPFVITSIDVSGLGKCWQVSPVATSGKQLSNEEKLAQLIVTLSDKPMAKQLVYSSLAETHDIITDGVKVTVVRKPDVADNDSLSALVEMWDKFVQPMQKISTVDSLFFIPSKDNWYFGFSGDSIPSILAMLNRKNNSEE